ncbi:peptidylprolyl isomerase [candidate division KSB1 bacterium]|nr:peptidylprolyl isomerase [candidate division KSB1 bacterium]
MRIWILVIGLLLISTYMAAAQDTLKQGDEVFIKEEFENIRLSPNGTIVTQLPQGTRLTVLGEQNNWVAVQFVGWIWKPSLVTQKTKIKGLTIHALHILVKTEPEAKEIKQLLASGKNFAELAKERSIGPNAERGGDLGQIEKGDLLPELDAALRKLQNGEVSGIIKTDLGYHILKRID